MPINQKPPAGLLRFLFRLPIFFFRIGMGPIFGRRILLLNHTGRKSGFAHQTAIEVVRHDPQTGVYYIASAWGEKADWYRNLAAHPEVTIQVKNQRTRVRAHRLSAEHSGEELFRYSKTYPLFFRELKRLLGFPNIQTEAEIHALGKLLPMIALEPLESHLPG